MSAQAVVGKLDTFQREHPWAGFPLAVVKKFGDDRGGYLAALIAYYGFFSLFPLLLVFVTGLFFVLGDNPALRGKIVNSALSQFPVIGQQIQSSVAPLHGSTIALVIGIAGALWGGMGVVQVTSHAMDTVWNVPVREKPSFIKARLRALVMLAVLGAATIVAAGLSGIAAGGGTLSPVLKVFAFAGSLAVNFGVFLMAFKVLTSADVSWQDVVPGALVAAVAWGVLQTVGNYYVTHQLRHASQTYGTFAIVIGLLSWLYLGGQVTIIAAEINVVRARGLSPRSIKPPLTQEEKRALRQMAKQEERRPEERVDVGFDAQADSGGRQTQPEQAARPSPAPESRAAPTGRPYGSDPTRQFPRF
jgi:YihY family inner membrane protein